MPRTFTAILLVGLAFVPLSLHAQEPKLLATLEPQSGLLYSVAFKPDGNLLASGGDGGMVQLWDVKTGLNRTVLRGHSGTVYCVAFSPDGRMLASASSDKTVKLWEINTGKLRATLQGHTYGVRTVAFSGDGKVLASGSGDRHRIQDHPRHRIQDHLAGV